MFLLIRSLPPTSPVNFFSLAKLKKLTGDVGGSDLINKNIDLLYKINVSNLSVTTDLDTKDDWNTFEKSNSYKVYFDN